MKSSKFMGALWTVIFLWGAGHFSPGARGQNIYEGIKIVEPSHIQVGSFFSGKEVRVKAIFPKDCDLALRLWGPRQDLKLRRKGRVGRLWMNVNEVTFQEIPQVYLLWTSRKLPQEGEGSLQELGLDYGSLLRESLPGKTPEEKQFLIQELVKLKEYDNLYHIWEGVVRTQHLGKGLCQAEAVLHLPAKIPPASYRLDLIALKEGKNTLLNSSALTVQLTGFPASLSRLANQNGLLYGVLAVGIAALCGLGMGVFFSSRRGH